MDDQLIEVEEVSSNTFQVRVKRTVSGVTTTLLTHNTGGGPVTNLVNNFVNPALSFLEQFKGGLPSPRVEWEFLSTSQL